MAGYKPAAIQTYPILGEKITQDTLYWNNYKTPVQIKEFGAVSKIDFSLSLHITMQSQLLHEFTFMADIPKNLSKPFPV